MPPGHGHAEGFDHELGLQVALIDQPTHRRLKASITAARKGQPSQVGR
jgi:hypothetical protein